MQQSGRRRRGCCSSASYSGVRGYRWRATVTSALPGCGIAGRTGSRGCAGRRGCWPSNAGEIVAPRGSAASPGDPVARRSTPATAPNRPGATQRNRSTSSGCQPSRSVGAAMVYWPWGLVAHVHRQGQRSGDGRVQSGFCSSLSCVAGQATGIRWAACVSRWRSIRTIATVARTSRVRATRCAWARLGAWPRSAAMYASSA